MNTFDIIYKETEVLTNQLLLECANIHLESEVAASDGVYLEDGDKKGIIKTIIESIQNIINAVVERIRGFFKSGGNADKKLKQVENNPTAKKKKVKIKDYRKLKQANDDTMKKISKAKSKEEVNSIMANHNKKRNAIIAGSAVLVTVAACAGFCLKRRNAGKAELEKRKSEVQTELQKRYKRSYDVMQAEEKAKIKETVEAVEKAMIQIVKDDADDMTDGFREMCGYAYNGYEDPSVNESANDIEKTPQYKMIYKKIMADPRLKEIPHGDRKVGAARHARKLCTLVENNATTAQLQTKIDRAVEDICDLSGYIKRERQHLKDEKKDSKKRKKASTNPASRETWNDDIKKTKAKLKYTKVKSFRDIDVDDDLY